MTKRNIRKESIRENQAGIFSKEEEKIEKR